MVLYSGFDECMLCDNCERLIQNVLYIIKDYITLNMLLAPISHNSNISSS